MLHPETPQKVDERQQEQQAIGEGLLIGVRDKPHPGLDIDGCPLIGRDVYPLSSAQGLLRKGGGIIDLL